MSVNRLVQPIDKDKIYYNHSVIFSLPFKNDTIIHLTLLANSVAVLV